MKAGLITLCAVALLSSRSGVAAQEPSSYDFTLIADTSAALSALSATASLNNGGTVSFIARRSGGAPAVFTGNGGRLTLLADGNGLFSGFGAWYTSINGRGTVAFTADLVEGGAGMFAVSRQGVTAIGPPGSLTAIGLRPSINNAGTVAFLGSPASAPSEVGLFAGRDETLLTLYQSGPQSLFSTFGSPAINENGTVAFLAGVRGTPDWSGIFTGKGGAITLIADSRSGFAKLDSEPSINNAGTVAFSAILIDGVSAIFVGDGRALATVADSTGPFRDLGLSSPVINNNGSVVFFAELDSGGIGIFAGPDPLADKVIAVGDPLLGSMVMEFFVNGSRLGFNDRGEVAFVARLADGRDVVVRATPQRRSI